MISNCERELGVPLRLVVWEDCLFRLIRGDEFGEWNKPDYYELERVQEFLEAIRPGADLSMVVDHLAHWLTLDPKEGLIRFAKSEPAIALISSVGELYRRQTNGEVIDRKEWRRLSNPVWKNLDKGNEGILLASRAEEEAYQAAAYLCEHRDDSLDGFDTNCEFDPYCHAAISSAADAATAGMEIKKKEEGSIQRKHFVRMWEKLLELLRQASDAEEAKKKK